MGWVKDAKVTTSEDRQRRANKISRSLEIESSRVSEGMRELTIEEARDWIITRMERPGSAQEKLEDITSIFLKMVPYLLEE